jgi:hypothetical protein
MTIIRTLAAAATLAAAFTVATPASADVATFANFTGVGGANIFWKQSVSKTGGEFFTITHPGDNSLGAVATRFTFASPNPGNRLDALAALGQLSSSFTFNAFATSGNPAGTLGGFAVQPLSTGSFSFIYTGAAPLVVAHTTYHTGANLLTATFFTGGGIAGSLRGSSGSVNASTTAGDTITYKSDFLNFDVTRDQDFSLSLASITPPLAAAHGQSLRTFFATATGSFSTDPAPLPTAIIPEPATWGLLVVGFGLVGLQGRRRSRSASVAA